MGEATAAREGEASGVAPTGTTRDVRARSPHASQVHKRTATGTQNLRRYAEVCSRGVGRFDLLIFADDDFIDAPV